MAEKEEKQTKKPTEKHFKTRQEAEEFCSEMRKKGTMAYIKKGNDYIVYW